VGNSDKRQSTDRGTESEFRKSEDTPPPPVQDQIGKAPKDSGGSASGSGSGGGGGDSKKD
jgi:hypothetical protein